MEEEEEDDEHGVCVCVCLSVCPSFTSHVLGTVRTSYIYLQTWCVCVYPPRGASVRPSSILLAGTQGNGYNSVSGVSYWLELRVMGITQCQGYPIGWNSG
jgi:hypothetical protein